MSTFRVAKQDVAEMEELLAELTQLLMGIAIMHMGSKIALSLAISRCLQ